MEDQMVPKIAEIETQRIRALEVFLHLQLCSGMDIHTYVCINNWLLFFGFKLIPQKHFGNSGT